MTGLAARTAEALDRARVRDGVALVAVSGGPDSLALLDLVAGLAPGRGLRLVVAHFDHGIHPESAAVAARVSTAAARYGLPMISGEGRLGPGATETVARVARLAWLERARMEQGASWILLGHHRDDQVETLLMRFLRGSAPAGLAGIRLESGSLVRPLLELDRAELAEHLRSVGLPAWRDPANVDPRHLRGWIRVELIPALERRLGAFRDGLLAGQTVAADERTAWERLLEELPGLEFDVEPGGASVAVPPLAGYSSAVVRGLLRALGRRAGVPVGAREVGRLQTLVAQGHTGQRVDLRSGAFGELAFGRLGLFRAVAHPTTEAGSDVGSDGAVDFGAWTVRSRPDVAPVAIPRVGFTTWVPAEAALRVRPWRPGDRIRPIRGSGTRLVVRGMQEEKIPRRRRPGWPVLVHQDRVIWVPGVCRGDAMVPEPGTKAVRIDVSSR